MRKKREVYNSSHIQILEEEVKKLTGRCAEMTDGTMCKFCDVRCKFRSEKYVGEGERI